MKTVKVLALYRGHIADSRGTPIRVHSLMSHIAHDPRVAFSVASWDVSMPEFPQHLHLSNQHLKDIKKLREYIVKNNIDILLGHTISSSYYLLPLKFLTKAKIVLEMHGLIEEEAKEYNDISLIGYWLLKQWTHIFYRSCDLITTCSKGITDIVARHNSNSISLMGGVDTSLFSPEASSSALFKKDARIVIGYAGNTRIWQGLDFLLRAFKNLSQQNPNFRLVLLLSERKGLPEGGFETFGPVTHDKVPGFLIDCDILVLPRPLSTVTRISFPSKIPEYLAMGKPVVAANLGDLDQVIESGRNGVLYTPGDIESFALAVKSLTETSARERMGMAARETAGELEWSRLASVLVDNLIRIV